MSHYLVYLHLLRPLPDFYCRLDEYLSAHGALVTYGGPTNKALLLLHAVEDQATLEREIAVRCWELDRVRIMPLKGTELEQWLFHRRDWQDWQRDFPDLPAHL
ncbi:MAG: hypothetical protein AB1705_24100 [Verrucomicrobiota bacterium]